MDILDELGITVDLQQAYEAHKAQSPKTWTEHDHCRRLNQWAREMRKKGHRLKLTKITNEGKRSMAEANKAVSEGIEKGFPDYLVMLPNRIFFVEMKSPTGTLRKEQREQHAEIEEFGHEVFTCKGWMQARDLIKSNMID